MRKRSVQNRMKPFTGDPNANNDEDDSDSDDKSFKRRLEKSIKKDLDEAEVGRQSPGRRRLKSRAR